MLSELIAQLEAGRSLAPEEVQSAVNQLTDEAVPTETKAAFLTALAAKGETPGEITAFAGQLRDRAVRVPLDEATRRREIIDVCGTGGDRLGTFNISTTVALLLAAADVTVAKHGNRAVTSKSGSADVLEALGIRVDLSPTDAAAFLAEHHFAFFFAPLYHPAFKHIAPARKLCAERGRRTIFNFLGPLLNPVRPSAQVIGVPQPALCEPLARVLKELGIRRGMVVSGRVGDEFLDELSTLGETTVAGFREESEVQLHTLAASDFPVQPARLEDLAGGDVAQNAAIIRDLLAGKDRGPKRDAVLYNAGAAFVVGGVAPSIGEGWKLAAETIDSGKATAKLDSLAAASRD